MHFSTIGVICLLAGMLAQAAPVTDSIADLSLVGKRDVSALQKRCCILCDGPNRCGANDKREVVDTEDEVLHGALRKCDEAGPQKRCCYLCGSHPENSCHVKDKREPVATEAEVFYGAFEKREATAVQKRCCINCDNPYVRCGAKDKREAVDTLDAVLYGQFAGNQLAIVRLPHADAIPKARKQQIAREFNFSETVFLHRRRSDAAWAIDIFSPEAEMAFAGHPVIGTGHYLFSLLRGLAPFAPTGPTPDDAGAECSDDLVLHTASGPVSLAFDPATSLVHASIPHNVHQHTQHPATWTELLPTQPHLRSLLEARTGAETLRQPLPTVSIVKGVTYVLCDLTQQPDVFAAVKAGPSPAVSLDAGWQESFVGVMYYKVLDGGADGAVKLRVRMVAIGLEDPACGSGSSALCAFLAVQRGAGQGGGKRVRFELEEGTEIWRQSFITVEVDLREGGVGIEEVLLAGKAAYVTKGEFFGV